MYPVQITSLFSILILSLFYSCEHDRNWTKVPSIPSRYQGIYKEIDILEYRIRITESRIIEIENEVMGDELSENGGIAFYLRNSWNKKYTQPTIICMNKNCSEYMEISFRRKNGVLIMRYCHPDYPYDQGKTTCEKSSEFVKL